MSHRKNPEAQIQRAVVQHLCLRGVPGLVWWHTPNGGYRNAAEAAIFKGMGVRPGVSDLILVHCGKIYALELKAEGGTATEAQLTFLDAMAQAGAYVAIAEGLNHTLGTLEGWGLLKPAVTMRGIIDQLGAGQ